MLTSYREDLHSLHRAGIPRVLLSGLSTAHAHTCDGELPGIVVNSGSGESITRASRYWFGVGGSCGEVASSPPSGAECFASPLASVYCERGHIPGKHEGSVLQSVASYSILCPQAGQYIQSPSPSLAHREQRG